jgi:hypothetical protein
MMLDKARSGLPKNLWVEAVLAAAYLVNRSPSEVLEMVTPAEMWSGVKPDLRKVKSFWKCGLSTQTKGIAIMEI